MTSTQPGFSSKYSQSSFHSNCFSQLNTRFTKTQKLLANHLQTLETVRNWRLFIGLTLVALGFVTAANTSQPIWAYLFLMTLPVFIWAIVNTSRRRRFCNQLHLLSQFYQTQLSKVAAEKLPSKDGLIEVAVDNSDLDLMGQHSLFRLLDATFSAEAGFRLANKINQGLPSKDAIQASHKKIVQLQKSIGSCRRFIIEGQRSEHPIQLNELQEIFSDAIVDRSYLAFAAAHILLFPMSIITFFMIGYGKVQLPLALPIVVYAVFSLISLRAVLASFRKGEILERSLQSLVPVFRYIEKRRRVFELEFPSLQQKSFHKSLSFLKYFVSFLSVQAHPLVYLVVNALCPWTFTFSGLAERWRKKNKQLFLNLLEELVEAEVSTSMALFYYYQTRTLPKFADSFELTGQEVYHPLIPRKQVVANDVRLNGEPSIMILTGSNMSGKSTYMRAIAVNQTLAMAGAPVFAKHFITTFAPVITCMQVKDSLEMGYSYFYAEVRRVKTILDAISSGKKLFFFIDEIFKGTNNRERLIGSQAVVKALIDHQKARGIISTHDLELAHVADGQPQVGNFHFKDEVNKNALVFSYTLQPGPCPTTNALKIMRFEGLPIPQ